MYWLLICVFPKPLGKKETFHLMVNLQPSFLCYRLACVVGMYEVEGGKFFLYEIRKIFYPVVQY